MSDYISKTRLLRHLNDVMLNVAPVGGEIDFRERAAMYKGVQKAFEAVEAFDCENVLAVSEIEAMCNRAAKVNSDCYHKALHSGRFTDADMAAVAWFDRQQQMYKYFIPGVIRELLGGEGNDDA